jgi:hypothetical protein
VPNRVLIAVGKSVGMLSDVPCLAIANNNWKFSAAQTMEFCEKAVQQRGAPFRDLVGQAKTKSTSIKCRFQESPFTVHYAGLDEEISLNFIA